MSGSRSIITSMGAVERLDHVHDGHLRFASASAIACACCSRSARAAPRTRPRTSRRRPGSGRCRACRSFSASFCGGADLGAELLERAPRAAPRPIRRGRSDAASAARSDRRAASSRRHPGRPVGGRVVARRMALDAIGEQLDQGRPEIGARAVGGPARRRIDGERVVAVDPQAGNAVADRARGEGGQLAAGDARRRSRSPTGC